MAILTIPEKNQQLTDATEIRAFFQERGIFFDQWQCDADPSAVAESLTLPGQLIRVHALQQESRSHFEKMFPANASEQSCKASA